MAHRSTHPLSTVKSECTLVTCKLVGAGTSAMTLPETAPEISSVARTGVGTFTCVFRHKYPELKSIQRAGHIGTTAGLSLRWTAIDLAAGTGAFTTEVGAVATDPATTDTIYVNLLARNSGRNA